MTKQEQGRVNELARRLAMHREPVNGRCDRHFLPVSEYQRRFGAAPEQDAAELLRLTEPPEPPKTVGQQIADSSVHIDFSLADRIDAEITAAEKRGVEKVVAALENQQRGMTPGTSHFSLGWSSGFADALKTAKEAMP